MHQPVKDYLEDYLWDPQRVPREVQEHIAACASCAKELDLLVTQNRLFESLRSPLPAEPEPGFYGRILSRIDEQTPDSIWSLFLEPAFGRRLSIACAALVVVFGTYLVRTEPFEHPAAPAGIVASQPRSVDVPPDPGAPNQRDLVLVNLVTFRE